MFWGRALQYLTCQPFGYLWGELYWEICTCYWEEDCGDEGIWGWICDWVEGCSTHPYDILAEVGTYSYHLSLIDSNNVPNWKKFFSMPSDTTSDSTTITSMMILTEPSTTSSYNHLYRLNETINQQSRISPEQRYTHPHLQRSDGSNCFLTGPCAGSIKFSSPSSIIQREIVFWLEG